MLVDFDILKKFGSDEHSFRRLFTSSTSLNPDLADIRKKWEDVIESRIHEGTLSGVKNYQFYAASDLAWDSNLITRELVPLQLYAQKKITFETLRPHLNTLSDETRSQFVKTNEKNEITGIDIPAFHKVVVNLVRSLITRRSAALASRYTKLQPLYRYEPLSTSFVAKLRGDALSQRVEMITNAYGYRHDMIQSIRSMLMYGHSLEFAATAWDQDKQYRKKKVAAAMDTSKDSNFDVEAYIAREGLLYERPHPSRKFCDNAFPTSSVNTDTGCRFMGYWTMTRFSNIARNPVYFNRNEVQFDQSFMSGLAQYKAYWELYYATAPVNFPSVEGGADVPGNNDRLKNVGLYNPERGDQSVLLTEYREKVIPKDVGLGDYPFPIWVRLVVAGGRTIIFGEFLPSIPATYWGYNEDDNRQINNGWAHDALPWQDLLSNGLSNLVLSQRSALIKLLMLDVDLVNDPKVLADIRSIVKGESIYNRAHLIEFKGSQLAAMDEKPREALTVAETQPIQDLTMHYKSLMQILALAERILGISSNESAQSEPREISATESSNIASTTDTSIAFMGIGVDEAVDAKKRQLYESLIALGSSRVQIPAVNRYTKKTVKEAGFVVLDEAADQSLESMYVDKSAMLLGNKDSLVYDYNFSSRDGSERASNAKAAEVLVNLLAQLVQFPGFAEAIGKERLFTFLNEVVLLSGAGVDLRFEMQDGENPAMPSDGSAEAAAGAAASTQMHDEAKTANEEALHQVIDAITADRQKIAQLTQMVQQLGGAAPAAGQGAPPPEAPPVAPAPAAPAPMAPQGLTFIRDAAGKIVGARPGNA